jgi:hypothetical protein
MSSIDQGGGKRRSYNVLCCALGSSAQSLVGNPVAMVSNWKILLAHVANWLGRRSNTMADDFVNRPAGRAKIEKVLHFSSEGYARQRA